MFYTVVGSFVSETRVQVMTANDCFVIEGNNIFINKGNRPIIPDIPWLMECTRAFVSETMMDVSVMPRELVIIGGGWYIGLELSMYAVCCSHVTVL